MKSIIKISLLGALTASFFVGCSSKPKMYEIIFDTNPRGATLVCGGENYGYTPVRLSYDPVIKQYSTVNVSNCSAIWVSGYSANYSETTKIFPEGQTVTTLNRPTNEEGYSMDAQFALQVSQLRAQQDQAFAAQMSAAAQQQANFNQSLQNVNNSLNNSYQQQQYMYNNTMNTINSNQPQKEIYQVTPMAPDLFRIQIR